MRILVVEDAKDMNRLIVKTLTKAGYNVDGCYDAVSYTHLDVYKRQTYNRILERERRAMFVDLHVYECSYSGDSLLSL